MDFILAKALMLCELVCLCFALQRRSLTAAPLIPFQGWEILKGSSMIPFKIFWSLSTWNHVCIYRESQDSTNFVLPGNRTIAKIVLSGGWFSTKIVIYEFWIFKVPSFSSFSLYKSPLFLIINPNLYISLTFITHKKN